MKVVIIWLDKYPMRVETLSNVTNIECVSNDQLIITHNFGILKTTIDVVDTFRINVELPKTIIL